MSVHEIFIRQAYMDMVAAVLLAEALVRNGGILQKFGEDALHIAICAANKIGFLWKTRGTQQPCYKMKM